MKNNVLSAPFKLRLDIMNVLEKAFGATPGAREIPQEKTPKGP
jgi:hypothetical protein